MELNSSNLGRI